MACLTAIIALFSHSSGASSVITMADSIITGAFGGYTAKTSKRARRAFAADSNEPQMPTATRRSTRDTASPSPSRTRGQTMKRLALCLLLALPLAGCAKFDRATFNTLAVTNSVLETAQQDYESGKLPHNACVYNLINRGKTAQGAAQKAFLDEWTTEEQAKGDVAATASAGHGDGYSGHRADRDADQRTCTLTPHVERRNDRGQDVSNIIGEVQCDWRLDSGRG